MEGRTPLGQRAHRQLLLPRHLRAIVYQNRTGCQWSLLPNDLPPEGAVRYYFYTWRDCGLDQTINENLRCQAREKAGRAEDPTLAVIDTQSLHNSVNVPASTTGRDAAKKVPGRKHGIAIDILGLITAVVISAASTHENTIGKALITQMAATTPSISKLLVDQGFKDSVVTHGAEHGMDVEIVARNPEPGFHPQPIRWRVEQVLGTLMLQRRLVRDYESDPRSSASRIYWASIVTMTKRLTGTSTLEKIAAREQALQATADQLTSTIAQLTAQLEAATAELGDLATARRVLLRLDEDEPQPPNLPDNPIYQEILTLFTDTASPIQARAVCERLGLSTEKNSVEGMRSKLNRLVRRGLLLGDDAGRFELARH